MAFQYHYNISCKRISGAGWVTTTKAEQGQIPMSIVQPGAEVDLHSQSVETSATLTTEPLVREISDTSLVTAYLRGLNRRPGWELAWHNDSVIWNLSLRLGKLEIGQEVKVRVSYFSNKGISSGIYEIQLLDVFPEDTPTKNSPPESVPSPQSTVASPSPNVANKTGSQLFSSSASGNRQEDAGDTVSQLTGRVENLQDQLMMVRKTLHQALERIERLETRNRETAGIGTTQDMIPQRPPQDAPEPTAQQPAALSEETVIQAADTEDDADEPNLFEYLAQSQTKSATVKHVSTSNDNVKNSRKKQ